MILTWQLILIGVAMVFLVVASYTDLKKREVPDWLNFSLMFSALGLRALYSFEYGWSLLLDGVLGFLVCLGIAYLFYHTNQWGGGDSKLLMGMGAVIGLGFDFQNWKLANYDFSLIIFFIGLFLFGAVFALIWSMVLAFRNKDTFFQEFKDLLSNFKKWHYLSLIIGFGFLIGSFFYSYLWPLIIFPGIGFYTICFIKGVEKKCFIKKVKAEQLVEGDWLAEDIALAEDVMINKNAALEKKDIWKLRHLQEEGKIKKIVVKEGVPFVPSFLLSYLAIIFGSELVRLFV